MENLHNTWEFLRLFTIFFAEKFPQKNPQLPATLSIGVYHSIKFSRLALRNGTLSKLPKKELNFRDRPGCRERHVQRKLNNPLFSADDREQTPQDLTQAQRKDNEELGRFMKEVRELVQEISGLGAKVESDVILKLKSKTDRYYEQCVGLPGNQHEVKQALNRLVDVMMSAIRKEAEQDATAMAELERESVAREMHYSLLEYPLTGDLLRQDSPIDPTELIPTLLSEPAETLRPILTLFATDQLKIIRDEARKLIEERKNEGLDLSNAETRLVEIESYLNAHPEKPAVN